VNRTLSQLLCVVIQKNLKSSEKCFSFVEFAYNRTVYSTIDFYSFEIIWGFNPLTRMDLIPLPLEEKSSLDGEKKKSKDGETTSWGVQLQIEKINMLYTLKENKGYWQVVFQPGD
jgi:hypothetical protein